MKKLFLLLIPITLIFLGGCSDKGYYVTTESMDKVASDLQEHIYSLQGGQKVLDEKINAVDAQTTKLFGDYSDDEKICVGITNIQVTIKQSKKLFECIGNGEGYCNCIEKYATCDARLSDIPEEYRNDFNPECFYH